MPSTEFTFREADAQMLAANYNQTVKLLIFHLTRKPVKQALSCKAADRFGVYYEIFE